MDDAKFLAQENTLREGRDPADRLLLQALADPALAPLPHDFAVRMAMLTAPKTDERPELLLQYGLLALLVLSGLVLFLPDTMPAGPGIPGWLMLVLLCLALSATPSFLGRRSY